jgi:pimeloyl-ACP methyl ester carboxylesterase
VIGHSVGGVLAVDYAARARSLRLPRAAGLMIIYPGGAIKDMPPVPEEDPALIPPGVRRLLVLASPTDQLVGTAPAEAIATGAVKLPPARRRLITVDDEAAGDHFAPALDSAATRREFWERADRLISLAR